MSLSKFARADDFTGRVRMGLSVINPPKPRRRFEYNEVSTAEKLITELYKNKYTLLLAQPQSGKTNSYHLAGAELIRQRKFNIVKIICGNSEIELKDQLIADKRIEFFKKYRHYLRDNECLSEDEIDDTITLVESNMQVLCGAELNKANCDVHCTDILIIWDESHHAQSIINRPNKFLERNGIPPNGIFNDIAVERNLGFISVSATPISELCANLNEGQHKTIIRMKPGEGYKGVKDYLNRDLVKGISDNWLKQLPAILQLHKSTVKPQWALIRTRDNIKKKQYDEIKRIAAENNWSCLEYNSTNKCMSSLADLAHAPPKDTIILLKDMCRMGKSINKTHISFVMETALDPKTDTIAQGLMGRVFGYDNDHDIYVYIANKVLKKDHAGSSELSKYVHLMEGSDDDDDGSVTVIPSRALNVIPINKRETVFDLYPIVINGFTEDRDDPDYSEFNTERIQQYVKTAITDGNIQNKNSIFHTEDITKQLNDPTTRIVIHKIENRNRQTNPTYTNVPDLLAGILADREQKNVVRSLPGCGINSSERAQVNAWVFTSNQYNLLGFSAGKIVIQAISKFNDMGIIPVNIPKTTSLEAFTTKREDHTELIGNGTQATTLSPDSSTSVDTMKTSIVELIRISLVPREAVTVARCITSNQDTDTGEWQGIMVNDAVYVALQKGGIIYTHIKSVFNLKIKTSCQRGQPTKACRASGLKRLCKIEW